MIPRKTTFPAIGMALAAGIVLFGAAPVFAAQNPASDPVISAAGKAGKSDSLFMKLSQEGFWGMRAVKAARIAIFGGNTDLAKKMVDAALKSLKAAAQNDTKYVTETRKANLDAAKKDRTENVLKNTKSGPGPGGDRVIPIDVNLAIADNFAVTPEKKAKIAEANQNFKKGKANKAIETLRLASIDVVFQRVLMPVGRTIEHVKLASGLVQQQKFYQANLALKAAEDGLVLDTVNHLIEPTTGGNIKAANMGKKTN